MLTITENPNLIYAVFRSQKKFQLLRDMTLDINQIEAYISSANTTMGNKKPSQPEETSSVANSHSSLSASDSTKRDLSFAIGDDEDDEESPGLEQESSDNAEYSRSGSISSSLDEAVPIQLRGMSEKARGKLPAGHNTFSRQSTNLTLSDKKLKSDSQFTASNKWVSLQLVYWR